MDKGTMALLIIDDDADVRRSLRAFLASKGFGSIETASSPEEGVELATQNRYDVILLDMLMPHKSGWDVLEDLRARGIETRVMVVSAVGMPQSVREELSHQYAHVDLLPKTQIVTDLEERIEEMMHRPAQVV